MRSRWSDSGAAKSVAGLAAASMLAGSLTACGPKKNAASQLTEAPTMTDATGESKCSVAASASKPLVVEWPAAERAALESRALKGLVAVRYQGCEMEVLTNCTVDGEYAYTALNEKREGVRIKSADELYAQLPVGAAGLEAKLETSGQLNVDMVIIGRKEASESVKYNERHLNGRCDDATHVITGLTVGAFSFYTGSSAAIGAGVKVGQVGVGAGSSADTEVLKQDGDEDACSLAEPGALEPPAGCGALLRVEVVPIDYVFDKGAGSSGSLATSSGSTSSGSTTDTGPAPDTAKQKKRARLWTAIGIGGFGLGLAGTGALLGGVVLQGKAKTKLEEGVAPGEERRDAIRNAGIASGLVYGGIAAAITGYIVGYVGLARAKSIKRGTASVTPVLGPSIAGANMQVRF